MRLAGAHLRFLRFGTLGALAGHGFSRVATRTDEVEHALALHTRVKEPRP